MEEISNTTQKRIEELTQLLTQYNISYYQNHKSIVSDKTYDMMMNELISLEKAHPEYALPYSPTQHVGSDHSLAFSPVHHNTPMQSLENTYTEPEIAAFMTTIQKIDPKVEFVTEFKIDGLSISCIYQDGKLIQASTRGDGISGDDVTRNALYIQDIPKVLQFPYGTPHIFEIRGEVFMTYSDFIATNKIRDRQGLPPLANPRNAASGTLKTLDPSVFKTRKLHALFYHVAEADELPDTQENMFHLFDKLKIPHAVFWTCSNQSEVLKTIGKIAQLRDQLPYPTDGAVVKVNNFHLRSKLGSTSKCPRWAKAYKFAAEQARTTIRSITIQVGRTGVLTPVAELNPVQLGGSIVKRATLHNSDMIRKLDIRIGDTVLLEKAGEVIPHILCSIDHQKNSKPYYLYQVVDGKCPICGEPIHRKEDEVAWKCMNTRCPARVEEQIIYATGKDALDINGLGRVIVRALLRHGKIKSMADLFRLSESDLVNLPLEDGSLVGINGSKIWRELQNAPKKDLSRWITALGIKGVGPTIAKKLASKNVNLWLFRNNMFIPNPTNVVEENIKDFVLNDGSIIDDIMELGINPVSHESKSPKTLDNKTFVITGKLSRPRAEIEQLITNHGGKISNSVSKFTSFLIQGEDDRVSSKSAKAKELGIMVINEQQLMDMCS